MRGWVTERPITAADLLERVGSEADGAIVLFLGTVRSENDGRAVLRLRYDAYVEMAERVLAEIAEEAALRVGSRRIAVAHRVGELAVGEISVGIAISTPHRAEAYDGSRYIIEEIKKRLPVWKQEEYVGGEHAWLDGETASPPHPLPPRGEGSEDPVRSQRRAGAARAPRTADAEATHD